MPSETYQKKHLRQHKIALVNWLSYFFNLRSIYSNPSRIIRQMAIIKEPKAKVPKWYLKLVYFYLIDLLVVIVE